MNSPPAAATPTVSQDNGPNLNISNSSFNRSAISSIKLVSVSDEAIGKDKASLTHENNSNLIRNVSTLRDKDLVGTQAPSMSSKATKN